MSDPNEEAIEAWQRKLYHAAEFDGREGRGAAGFALEEAVRDLITSVVEATREQCAELADESVSVPSYDRSAVAVLEVARSIRSLTGLPNLRGPQ